MFDDYLINHGGTPCVEPKPYPLLSSHEFSTGGVSRANAATFWSPKSPQLKMGSMPRGDHRNIGRWAWFHPSPRNTYPPKKKPGFALILLLWAMQSLVANPTASVHPTPDCVPQITWPNNHRFSVSTWKNVALLQISPARHWWSWWLPRWGKVHCAAQVLPLCHAATPQS